MFYSVELLSLRQRGKLAQCWLAATLSKETFMKKFRSSTISAIDVPEICNEIVSALEIRSNNPSRRLSLYLSSQLMYGITIIFSYQTNILKNQLFQLRISYSSAVFKEHTQKQERKSVGDFHEDFRLTIPEPPPLTHGLFKETVREELVTLNDDFNLEIRLAAVMQDADCLNFGGLTSMELDDMLLHDIRSFPDDQGLIRIINGFEQIEPMIDAQFPLPAIEMSRREKVTTESSSRKTLSRSIDKVKQKEYVIGMKASESASTVSERIIEETMIGMEALLRDPVELSSEVPLTQVIEPKEGWPQTPKKRQSDKAVIETPSKRRRRALEESLETDPIIPAAAAATHSAMQNDLESDLELETLHLSATKQVAPRRRRREKKRILWFDEYPRLSNAELHACTKNVTAHTIKLKRPLTQIPSAEKLLAMPSTNMASPYVKEWGKALFTLFEMSILEPVPTADVISHETVRMLEAANKSSEPSVELSSGMITKITEDSSSHSKTAKRISFDSKIESNLKSTTTLFNMPEEVDGIQTEVQLPRISGPATSLFERVSSTETSHAEYVDTLNKLEDMSKILETTYLNSSEEKDEFLPPTMRARNVTKRLEARKAKLEPESKSTQSLIKSTSTSSFKTGWTKSDLMANLEVLLHDAPAVAFSQLCARQYNTKFDAAICLKFCIELCTERKISLSQSSSYHNIWIQKYISDSSSSTTDT